MLDEYDHIGYSTFEISPKVAGVLIDFLRKLPIEIHQMDFYDSLCNMSGKANLCKNDGRTISLEDTLWIFDYFAIGDLKTAEENIDVCKSEGDLEKFIVKVIQDKDLCSRIKLMVLLPHIEPLIYNVLNKQREKGNTLREF